MLKHLEFFLSGAFTYAPREGVLSGANPMRGDSIHTDASPGALTLTHWRRLLGCWACFRALHVWSLVVAAFSGLRKSEIRGPSWEDYQKVEPSAFGEIRVEHTVWGRHTAMKRVETALQPYIFGGTQR